MDTAVGTTQFDVTSLDDINQYSVDLGWDGFYTQLAGGVFHGSYMERLSTSVVTSSETWSLPVALKMTALVDYITIGMILSDTPARINGMELRSNQVALILPGAEFHITTSSYAVTQVALFPKWELEEKLGKEYYLIQNTIDNVIVFDLDRIDQTGALKDWFLWWLSNPHITDAGTQHSFTNLLHQIMYGAIDNISALLQLGISSDLVSAKDSRNYTRVTELVDYFYENPDKLVATHDMTQIAGMNRRTLYYEFKYATGYTPHQYFKRVRLAAMRRELLCGNDNVTRLATKYNFNHFGELSSHYKSIYGETPSKSMRKKLILVGS